ncbi:hypothetical protein RHSIM_RhsimUnG0057100 [Rhododendron simsii]|uniref:Uncharacterized protein n=1 Tax=Rhododendron simsii TaxID=118357 RepID=A0A834L4V1_RHOSS|nr:hypothetical protein RHSIM_RhsimUnG0057100 [Rhododendron simsii]
MLRLSQEFLSRRKALASPLQTVSLLQPMIHGSAILGRVLARVDTTRHDMGTGAGYVSDTMVEIQARWV